MAPRYIACLPYFYQGEFVFGSRQNFGPTQMLLPVVYRLQLTFLESAQRRRFEGDALDSKGGIQGGQLNANMLVAVAFGSSARVLWVYLDLVYQNEMKRATDAE